MAHFVTSGGLRLYYEEHGAGEPLVLMAGFGMDPSAWSEQRDVYAKFFRTVMIDLRGAGRSDVPEPGFTTKDLAGDVVDIVQHLGLGRIHFGGFSLGGAVGLELAIARPDLLRSLSVHSAWEASEPYAHFHNWVEVRRRIIAENDPVVNFGTRIVSFFSPQFINRRPDRIAEYRRMSLANPAPITAKGIEGHAQACFSHDVRGRLDRIRTPTLITIGGMDRTNLPSSSHYLHDQIEASEFVIIDGAGHNTMFECPQEFATISLGFLIKHSGQQGTKP